MSKILGFLAHLLLNFKPSKLAVKLYCNTRENGHGKCDLFIDLLENHISVWTRTWLMTSDLKCGHGQGIFGDGGSEGEVGL